MYYVLTKERLLHTEDYPNLTYIDTKVFIESYFAVHNPEVICVDTETTGLDFLSNKMVMFQFGTLQDQFIIDTRYYDIDFVKYILESRDIVKILHNAKFDYKFIRHTSSNDIQLDHVFDTMLADKVLNCGKKASASLAACSERYLNKTLLKDTRLEFATHIGPFTYKQIKYGCDDITVPIEIYLKQVKILSREKLDRVMQLENKAVLAFADIEFNGIGINTEKWLAKAEEVKTELDARLGNLNNNIEQFTKYAHFQKDSKQLDFFKEDSEISFIDINWNSPAQVLKIFQVDLPELESVGADVLVTIENKTEIIKSYMEFKKFSKLYNSYGPNFLEHIKADGKIHTSFSQILQTGRVSSSGPNMQQIPADNSFRNCFIVEDPDWVFVSSDYSSQELCVIATIAKDPVWLKALEEGKDLHSVCADLVFGKEWEDAKEPGCEYFQLGDNGLPLKHKCNCSGHKKLRTGVKTINFGLAYGMSEFALSDRVGISVQDARDLIATYFKTFPKIREALERFGNFGKEYGYIMTMPPFSRKRYFESHKHISSDSSISGTIERASKNTPIQGSSADMVKLAMIFVRNYIKEHRVPVKMVMVVHDQIDTITHKDYAPTWKIKLQDLMEKAAVKIITNGLLKAETDISPVWKK